jgi:hypothetical protein
MRATRESLVEIAQRIAPRCIFFLAVLAWGISARADPDLWWHLRLGRDILATGIPHLDIYSFTFTGRELIDHEWLAEVGMVGLYALGGVPALNLGFGLIAALAFWLVYCRAATGTHRYFAMVFALAAALGSTFIFGARPQVITLLGLAVLMWAIDRVRDEAWDGRHFWWFPLLSLVWANLHGGYLAGIALMGLYAVGDLLESVAGAPPERSLRAKDAWKLLAITVVSFGVTVLNPHGFHLWVLPFHEISTDISRQYIVEWMRPDLLSPPYMIFGLLLALAVSSFAVTRKRPWVSEGILFVGTATLGLLSVRHIPLFAVTCTPILCRRLWPVLRRVSVGRVPLRLAEVRATPVRPLVTSSILVVALVVAFSSFRARLIRISDNIEREYPVRAIEFIRSGGLDRQRGINEYAWGGYLIWRQIPVFIDGRAHTLYDAPFLSRYFGVYSFRESWDALARDFEVDYALVKSGHRWRRFLSAHPGWHEVYGDETATVFVAQPGSR